MFHVRHYSDVIQFTMFIFYFIHVLFLLLILLLLQNSSEKGQRRKFETVFFVLLSLRAVKKSTLITANYHNSFLADPNSLEEFFCVSFYCDYCLRKIFTRKECEIEMEKEKSVHVYCVGF